MHIFSECLIYICLFMCGSECINCVFIRSTTASQLSCKTVFGVRFNMWLPRCVYSCRNTAAAVADKSLGSSTYSRVTHRYQDSLRVCECERVFVCRCLLVSMSRAQYMLSSHCCSTAIRDNSRAQSNLLCFFSSAMCLSLGLVRSLFTSLHFSFRLVCARAAPHCCCSNVLFTCLPALKCLFFFSFIRSFVRLSSAVQIKCHIFFSRKKSMYVWAPFHNTPSPPGKCDPSKCVSTLSVGLIV